MKKKLLIFFCVILVLVAGYFIFSHYKNQLPHCLFIGDTQISIDIADTPPSQARGLSGRSTLFDIEGMLFIFPRDGKYGFWMKEMLFPIDIIWLDKDWKIAEITASVEPSTYPTIFYPEVPIRAVLEVAAGFGERHDVAVGDSITLCPR